MEFLILRWPVTVRRKTVRRKSPADGDAALHAWALLRCQRTYRLRNWAGKGPLTAIKHVSGDEAHWRPQEDQHNIAEFALHMAYWKDAVTAQLTCGKWKYSDAENWRTVPPTEKGWKSARAELDAAQGRLIDAIRVFPARRLMERIPAGGISRWAWRLLDFIVDIATHDSYHTAQIFVLRRLYVGRTTQA